MSRPRTYRCLGCPVHGGDHDVPSISRAHHLIAIAQKRAELEQERQEAEEEEAAAQEATALGNVLTAVIVTDTTDIYTQQQSRLFSGREEYQMSVADVPMVFPVVPTADRLAAVNVAVAATAGVLPTPATPARRPLRLTQTQMREKALRELRERLIDSRSRLSFVAELNNPTDNVERTMAELASAGELVKEAGVLLKRTKATLRSTHPEIISIWQDIDEKATELDNQVLQYN